MNNITMSLVIVAAVLSFNIVAYAEDFQVRAETISADIFKKFNQHTTDLREQLKAKDIELRQLYAYDGLDTNRVAELQENVNEIKTKIRSVAASMNIELCKCL